MLILIKYYTMIKSIFIVMSLIFISCTLNSREFENEYVKLTLPENWLIISSNEPGEDEVWLTAMLVPFTKGTSDEATEAYNQNIVINAVDVDEMSSGMGWLEFKEYVDEYWKSSFERGSVTPITKTVIDNQEALFFEISTKKADVMLLQRCYFVDIKKYYLSVITTQNNDLLANDSEQIVESIIISK